MAWTVPPRTQENVNNDEIRDGHYQKHCKTCLAAYLIICVLVYVRLV